MGLPARRQQLGHRARVVTAQWFPGRGRDAGEDAVLAEIRRQVARSGLADVGPERTAASVLTDQPLVLTVQVPGLARVPSRPELQVGLDPEEDTDACLLGAWETWGWVLDVGTRVLGSPNGRSPAALATSARRWLEQQLARPVEHVQWDVRCGRARSAWRFADDGELLAQERGVDRLQRRRPPDRVTRLR